MNTNLEIKVYDDDGNVKKTCIAEMIDLEFGAIRSIMEILNIESVENTSQLLQTVYRAWDQLTKILSRCFPAMEYEDWDNVKLKELMPTLVTILKYSFAQILTIPKDPKN